MPILEGLLKFVEGAELRSVDAVNRPEPSVWWEYTHSTSSKIHKGHPHENCVG
jgi:hypothetical protein